MSHTDGIIRITSTASQARSARERLWRHGNAHGVRVSLNIRAFCRYRNYLTQSDCSSLEEADAAMRAIAARQRVRTGLVRGAAAAAVLITVAACTSATATAGSTSTSSPGRTSASNANGSAAKSGGLVIATADGAVRGKAVAATDEYLGIPYAAPPVGALRWQPPKPPAPWHSVRAATSFAPHCPQPSSAFGVASTSEDCLYLNVFTPARASSTQARNLPVMVWVHGGSLRTGASEFYNPTGLVGHGVIVVTINYRLGALGFLADSALASRPGGPSG